MNMENYDLTDTKNSNHFKKCGRKLRKTERLKRQSVS